MSFEDKVVMAVCAVSAVAVLLSVWLQGPAPL